MPSSDVRYHRGDHYRHHDEDILRARRSSSSSSSVLSAAQKQQQQQQQQQHGKHFGSMTSAENAAIRHKINRLPVHVTGDEEYLTKKKVEVKTTKNTEKRVQRCVVLEDGRIIEHDDPHVIVDTIEDTQTHEFDHLDDRELAKELHASIEKSYKKAGIPRSAINAATDRRKSIAYNHHHGDNVISNEDQASRRLHNLCRDHGDDSGSIVNDTFKRIVNTHDVRENVVRTHAAKDLGMISKRGLQKVLNKKGKVSDYLKCDSSSDSHVAKRRKPVVHEYKTDSHKRRVNTEDIHEISRRKRDGQLHTETVRTEKHEVHDNRAAPDDSNTGGSGSSETEHDKDELAFKMTKKHEFTDYYDHQGNLLIQGPQLTSKDTKVIMPNEAISHFGQDKWALVSEDRIRQARNSMKKRLRPNEDAERTDALTKKPLDLNKEEKTRKKETDKWLERHFGSDWSLANDLSLSSGGRFKYLNTDSQFDPAKVRRTMSFSSIPINYKNPGEKVSRVIKQTTTTIKPGFDKHVVSSVTKSLVPNENLDSFRRHRSLDAAQSRPYHSTLTLATHGQDQRHAKKNASATSLVNETSQLTLRQVPITRLLESAQSPTRPPRKTRVQRLIDERRSQHGGSASSLRSTSSRARKSKREEDTYKRRSYFFGEDLHDRVQSEPPKRHGGKKVPLREEVYHDSPPVRRRIHPTVEQLSQSRIVYRSESKREAPKRPAPLYRTELLKSSSQINNPADDGDYLEESESMINRNNWRNELSKSYNDISAGRQQQRQQQQQQQQHQQHQHQQQHNIYSELSRHKTKEITQSYNELPKPSRLFGWRDEFDLPHNSYMGYRSMERSDGVPLTTVGADKVRRSKSFAVGTSSHSSDGSYNLLLRPAAGAATTSHHSQKTKSYKQTKVTSPPRATPADHYFPDSSPIIGPPKEFAGLSTKIQHHYDAAKRSLTTRPKPKLAADNVYEFERKIPMQSSILEAQKFKTVIFVSGN